MKPPVAAALFFAGCVILCGIGAHVAADLAALGFQGDADHLGASGAALASLALAASALLGCASLPAGKRVRGEHIAAIVRALPDGGVGPRFFALALGGDLGVFGLTEAAEGAPIDGGDLLLALCAAFAACIVGALLFVRYHRRALVLVRSLFGAAIRFVASPCPARARKRASAELRVRILPAILFSASRRPPPRANSFRPVRTISLCKEGRKCRTGFFRMPPPSGCACWRPARC